MKVSDIQVGGVYHDGKLGVREVVAKKGAPVRVTYRLLAAKIEQEYSHAERSMMPLVGSTNHCELASFAVWAKIAVPAGDKATLLADLAAKKLRLPAGEAAFMASVADSFDEEYPIKVGAGVSFNFNETRSARGVEKKGLVTVAMARPGAGGEVVLTEMGAAWARAHRQPATV